MLFNPFVPRVPDTCGYIGLQTGRNYFMVYSCRFYDMKWKKSRSITFHAML